MYVSFLVDTINKDLILSFNSKNGLPEIGYKSVVIYSNKYSLLHL